MKAVLVVEYDITDEAMTEDVHAAWQEAIKAIQHAPTVTVVSVRLGIREAADDVMAAIKGEEGQ